MSEMTSIVEQQQQQYIGTSSNTEHHCKDCGLYFESAKSLEVHLRYHQENLLSQWATQAQQEESNNNNSKAGNHNSHVSVKRDGVSAPAESTESSSRPPSQDPTSTQQQQQQQQQQPPNHLYNHYQTSMLGEPNYFMQNEATYILPHHFSPPQEDPQNGGGNSGGGGNYTRYHPYQHQQHFSSERATSLSSTSPHSPPLQCEKCGAVYEDANQLGEHIRANHSNSPIAYPSAPQYQQLSSSSPQHQVQQQQPVPQQQLHMSPPQSNQQQSGYDYNGGHTIKSEMKQEPEEQAEILDLDSHKVQTHRYEEELIRLQQQELQLQMHQQQVVQQQQRIGPHAVNPLIGWPSAVQPHDYHPGLSSMGPIDSVSPISEQNQFMRGPHIPVESPGHQNSPMITNTQPIPGHQMAGGLLQQPPKQSLTNQSWKSNEARRPKTYNCTACNKWFTSSGHLKRHYNTTLHKNAVKQSNQPDPAQLPISTHHHPGRDNNAAHASGRGGGGGASRSPELSSSGSPPNLMAGPSGEAARGLLHTPTTTTSLYNNNSSSSSSSESSAQALAQQQQQQPPSAVHLGSGMIPLNSPGQSSMGVHHQQQQMGSPSHQMGHQQQQPPPQQLHHLPMSSPGQLPVHHPMNSPISPMHHPPPPSHMNSPSQMGSSSHQHHMNSSSPMASGSVHQAMVSPTSMGGTTMPHQPYPNALPPHVTTTTSPGLLDSITIHLTTIGSDQHVQQQQTQDNLLPGFGTFSNPQRPLPSFTQFGITGFLVGINQPQAVNVGGQSPGETCSPQDTSYESSPSTYDPYTNSPPRYESMNNVDMQTVNTDGMIIKRYVAPNQVSISQRSEPDNLEANNNVPQAGGLQAKEEVNPNIGQQAGDQQDKEQKDKISTLLIKEHQVSGATIGSHYISQDGFHKCIECDKLFNKACYLTQHNKSFHSGDKPYKCNQCGKRFPHESQHTEHLMKHAGDKPYKCEVCPKQFNHKTDLRRHMCLHSGEKPYACVTCGKGFIRKDHMMKHVETHKKKPNNQQNVHLRA